VIDIEKEEALALSDAAQELKVSRRAMAASTLYRWTTNGCRGVKLEFVQIGGTRCTTKEALQRFFEAIKNAPRLRVTSGSPTKAKAARRAKASEQAARALSAKC
jgi:hypothetical protein